MKTNLFDVNGIEIQIGDKYIVEGFDTIYTVYFKAGCVCGGITEKLCSPLAWETDPYDEDELAATEDCTWLEIIITNEV